jgi:hypothetical protein
MSDLDDEIHELREKTEENRRQFLLTELQTCFITLAMASDGLAAGDIEMARKESAVAEHGIATIEHVLRDARDHEREIEVGLTELRALLVSLSSELKIRER